jgi:L-ascorbate metabolism protein UlaG (beta-lactamase superfamily)
LNECLRSNSNPMTDQKLYLKPNVVFEPLIGGWYAWSHLISPATASKNITGRHLKIMDSYIQSPRLHEMAVKNPAMRGGPFIDLKPGNVEGVRSLREWTLGQQRKMIEFSDALTALDRILQKHSRGFSLDEVYPLVPDVLKGYVELVYDINHNPTYRIYESLLYHSAFYDESYQSIALWITDNDERPFVLSTPRLDEAAVFQLNVPFRHSVVDMLSSMKRTGGSLDKILQYIDVPAAKQSLFSSLFTSDAPEPYKRYTGDKIRMRYFGHACILIETQEVSILIDPLISYYGYQHQVDRFSDIDLPDTIDYVLITHNHQDHILLETLLPLRSRIRNLIVPKTNSGALQDPSVKLMFQKVGFKNVFEIGELDTIRFEDCTMTGIPFIGEHCDLNIHAKICHHVRIGEFSLLFVADSCNIEPRLYDHVHAIVGDVDVIFLGMECEGAPLTWLYGPLLSEEIAYENDQSRRLAGSDFERAKNLVDAFNPNEVYVYAMGQEPWLEFISSIKYTPASKPIVQSDMLLTYCIQKNIVAERLYGEKEILYDKLTASAI